ncbi:MAG: alpha/beta hydrolase [Nakamurella sp.]
MTLALDPEVGAALQALVAQAGEPAPLAVGDVAGRREAVAQLLTALGSFVQPAPDVTVESTSLQVDGAELELRLYRPAQPSGSAALYVHGGGMIAGSVEIYDPIIRSYVQASGVPLVAVDYRLAPEFPHPTPVEDCFAALRWLVDHAADLGADPERIGVIGDSAGGGLSAGLALLARDRGVPVARQILIYPMLDDRNTSPDPRIAPFAVWTYDDNITGWGSLLGDAAGGDDVPPSAAPARAGSLRGLAPAYVEVGQLDIFAEEDVTYARRLMAAGVPTELHVHPGCPHAFEAFAPDSAVARRAVADRVRQLQLL